MDVWLLLKSDYCILWYYTVFGLQKVHLKPVWVFVACECSYPAWDRSHKSRKFAVCTYLMNSAYHISCWSNIAFLWKYLEIINLNQSRTSQEPIKNPFWRLWSDLRFANKENFSRLSTSVHSGHHCSSVSPLRRTWDGYRLPPRWCQLNAGGEKGLCVRHLTSNSKSFVSCRKFARYVDVIGVRE